MSYTTSRRSFRRLALGLAFAAVIFAGRVSAAPNADRQFFDLQSQTDDEQLRIEHALEAQAQGGLSGYLLKVVNGFVPEVESLTAADTGNDQVAVRPDGDQIAIEHELEALAQGGMAGYLNPQQQTTGTDRE